MPLLGPTAPYFIFFGAVSAKGESQPGLAVVIVLKASCGSCHIEHPAKCSLDARSHLWSQNGYDIDLLVTFTACIRLVTFVFCFLQSLSMTMHQPVVEAIPGQSHTKIEPGACAKGIRMTVAEGSGESGTAAYVEANGMQGIPGNKNDRSGKRHTAEKGLKPRTRSM